MPNQKSNPVGKTDAKFIICSFGIAWICFLTLIAIDYPNPFAGVLIAVMVLAIGVGALRLMHVIRDL